MPPSRSTGAVAAPHLRASPMPPEAVAVPSFYGPTLLALARRAIARDLQRAHHDSVEVQQNLRGPGACFVTLTTDGRLRGCIGSLEVRRSLKDDVEANARAAAFRDPRFAPLTGDEFDTLHIEVSVLASPVALPVASEEDAIGQLHPGTDGVILLAGALHGTFLPQVWHHLPDPHDFLAHLKQKAGLPADAVWQPDWRLSRYTVTAFSE